MAKKLTYQQIVEAFRGMLEDRELENVILNEKLKNIFDNANVPDLEEHQVTIDSAKRHLEMACVCGMCGKYAKYEELDSYTPFGCFNPANPEPYDPTMVCGECQPKLKAEFIEQFKKGNFKYGHWQKSRAELEAAAEYNLVWVGNAGNIDIEIIDPELGRRKPFNEYIPKDALPIPGNTKN